MLLPLMAISLLLAETSPPGDIRDVPADLTLPELAVGDEPKAGERVAITDPKSGVDYVLYLPTDWRPGARYPVIVELPGNGGYRNAHGDTCSGRPEGCKLGYGITAGRGVICLAVPFLNDRGDALALTWWGDKPEHAPGSSVTLLKRAVAHACEPAVGGDRDRVFLAGFSRGAIACNAIGLRDDEVARLWRGMIVYSHYEGVREGWPFAGADRESARRRLARLGETPQFICHEGNGIAATRRYLESTGISGDFTYVATGFRNHNDAWVLRPSPARKRLRAWFWRHAK